MKKSLAVIVLTFIFAFIVIAIITINTIFILNSTNFKDFTSKNLLLNSNFKDGFKNWSHDKNTIVTNINEKLYVNVKGIEKKQTRFWQNVNLESGKIYRLTFSLKGKQDGAFAICRDTKTGKEKYRFCNNNYTKKYYYFDVDSKRTGLYQIFLSTNKKGDYFFTNIRLSNIDEREQSRINFLLFLLLFLFVITILLNILYRYNIFFVITLIILIIFPVLKLNKDNISETENRTLAKIQPLWQNGVINKIFGNSFNSWLNDRFLGRNVVIINHSDIRNLIDMRRETKGAIQGKAGWLFQKFNPILFLPIQNVDSVISNKILKFQAQYSTNSCKTFFASIPEKNSVYSDFNYYRSTDEKLSKILSECSNFKFIFLLEEFKNEKDNGFLFFKDDHHWTERGAFFYCRKLVELCKSEFADLDSLILDDFDISKVKNNYQTSISFPDYIINKNYPGGIRGALNIDINEYNRKFASYYEVYNHKKYSIPKPVFSKTTPEYSKYVNRSVKNDLKIMIIGDSNIGYIVPFLTSIFHECLFLQINAPENEKNGWVLDNYSTFIRQYNPNIIFLITRSSNLQSWRNLSK